VYVASGSGASVVADSVVGASVVAESLSLEQAAKVTIDAKATVTPKIRRVVSDIGSSPGNSFDFRASVSGTMVS
jgi:hypothetical protein